MKIGFVPGNGTSSSSHNYEYSDQVQTGIYAYRLKQIDRDGKFEFSKEIEVSISSAPKKFAMEQNYPNPFNPSTTISYDLPKPSSVLLKVYTMIGQEVTTIVQENQPAGCYQVKFDGTYHASGLYIYRIVTKDFTKTRKMMFIK